MEKIELEIKEYSSKKLKEIIQEQSNAYTEVFIDYAKNELIRRGENFAYDVQMQEKIKNLNDDDLKSIVERDREDYHLEYLELAITEYLKRGFKNEIDYSSFHTEIKPAITIQKRYPALRTYSSIFTFAGFASFAGCLYILYLYFDKKINGVFILALMVVYVMAGIICLASAEAVKVFLDIEENTRKSSLK